MGNCLKSQLKSAINNDNLIVFGAFYIKVKTDSSETYTENVSNRIDVIVTAPMSIKVLNGNGKFKMASTDEYTLTSYDITFDANETEKTVTFLVEKDKEYTIILTDKYNVKGISNGHSETSGNGNRYKIWGINFEDFNYSVPRSIIAINTPNGYGSLDIKDLSELTIFATSNNSANFGNIDKFAYAEVLNYLFIVGCNNVNGNISSISGLTSLTYVGFTGSQNVSGEIDDFISAQISAGRTSGTLTFYVHTSNITDEGNLVTRSYLQSKGGSNVIVVTFDSSVPLGYTKAYN